MVKSMGKSSFYVLAFLISLTFLSGFLLSSSRVSADDSVVDDINITIPVACTLSGIGMTSHNATINNGTYDSEIGTTTLKAFCNDSEGFAIYAAGYTGDEIGGTNSNKLVGQSYNQTIVTGTATSAGNPDVSNWAMKLATITSPAPTYPIIIAGSTSDTLKQSGDPDFSNYTSVPNEYVKVAYRTSATDIGTNAEGSTLTTTYAAYISKNQVADSYQGKVIYTMVHPYNHAAPVVCNSNATTIGETLCMQDFADVTSANRTAIINSMVEGTQYTIKDKRDGKEYKIAKLADGNVWMTQNLDLDLDSGTTYTNLDTDIGYNTSTGTYDTAAWTPTRSTYAATSTQTHEWCQGGTWDSEYGNCENNSTPESYDPGNLYWNASTSGWSDWSDYYSSCNFSTSTPSCNESLNPLSTYVSSTGTAQYHLGNYYNWAAALATNDSSVYDDDDLVEQSICPAGWTLPRVGNGDDSFQALWEEYGYDGGFTNISDVWSSPLFFSASGFFGGALGDIGLGGSFWSPVPDGSDNAGFGYFYVVSDAYPSSSSARGYGDSVRCVARPVAGWISLPVT